MMPQNMFLKTETRLSKPFKKSSKIYKVFETRQLNENHIPFPILMLNEKDPKILYLAEEIHNQNKSFVIVSYQKQEQENLLLNYITDIVQLSNNSVVCSHYDGSLFIYKNLKQRQFKYNSEYIQIIEQNVNHINNINNVIQFISVFQKSSQLIILLEYYDARVVEYHFRQQDENFERINYQIKQNHEFQFRKYLSKEQILCGFIDQLNFGVIEKSQNDDLSLEDMKMYQIDKDVIAALKISTLNLVAFDVHQDYEVFYIVCIYENMQTNQQILCSYQLDRKNRQPQDQISINLICSFTLSNDLGRAVQIVSVQQNQRQNFQYDVVVLFQHKLMAFCWTDGNYESLIKSDENEEYKIYHFQIVDDIPHHLLISEFFNGQKPSQQVQYFQSYI